ncbi:hypothetical protein E2C01_007444 [Portunus trituberculatus]|uniref:Uncharacterized protein n=1 Tax=Portunus trituberculatus TaxID=210409 RepID=A0A5B7D164_PORTR|nr:hypothetical protein [Portunus trituberculatus]
MQSRKPSCTLPHTSTFPHASRFTTPPHVLPQTSQQPSTHSFLHITSTYSDTNFSHAIHYSYTVTHLPHMSTTPKHYFDIPIPLPASLPNL